jgi:hypothetical protein
MAVSYLASSPGGDAVFCQVDFYSSLHVWTALMLAQVILIKEAQLKRFWMKALSNTLSL